MMRNLTQGKYHISLGALLREAKNGDEIQLNEKHIFIYKNGNLLVKKS